MKKYFLILLVLAGLMAFSVSIASANGGPHGGYNATTDACAGCHRAHTATGPKLLVAADTVSLCYTCHGSTAAGAQTNVEDGVYAQYNLAGTYTNKTVVGTQGTGGAGLNGGGFVYAYNSVSGAFATTTSSHDVTSSITAAWGYTGTVGTNRGATANIASGLDCASCHDPHGTTGYRLLVAGPTATGQDYDSGAGNKNYTDEVWGDAAVSSLCASCHNAYHETGGGVGSSTANASKLTTPAIYTYTHRIDMPWNGDLNTPVGIGMGTFNPELVGFGTYTLPLANNGGTADDLVVCQTCHLPHGTAAAMGTYSASAGPTADSALLRLDNRGVCEVCHQK